MAKIFRKSDKDFIPIDFMCTEKDLKDSLRISYSFKNIALLLYELIPVIIVFIFLFFRFNFFRSERTLSYFESFIIVLSVMFFGVIVLSMFVVYIRKRVEKIHVEEGSYPFLMHHSSKSLLEFLYEKSLIRSANLSAIPLSSYVTFHKNMIRIHTGLSGGGLIEVFLPESFSLKYRFSIIDPLKRKSRFCALNVCVFDGEYDFVFILIPGASNGFLDVGGRVAAGYVNGRLRGFF